MSIILWTDIRGLASDGIVIEYDVFGIVRPVNCNKRIWSGAEQIYTMYNWHLLAIVETMTQPCYKVKGVYKMVLIECYHKNVE